MFTDLEPGYYVIDRGIKTTVTVVDATTTTLNFVNSYSAEEATVTIEGVKNLVGRDLVNGEFKFLLTPADGQFNALEGATAKIAYNVGGTFTFETLSFSEAGSYYFLVSEDTTVEADAYPLTVRCISSLLRLSTIKTAN